MQSVVILIQIEACALDDTGWGGRQRIRYNVHEYAVLRDADQRTLTGDVTASVLPRPVRSSYLGAAVSSPVVSMQRYVSVVSNSQM